MSHHWRTLSSVSTTPNGNPRALRNEADYLPGSLEDLIELRSRVITAGHSAPVANGLIGWLLSKANGEPDVTGPDTRAKYRKILAGLEVSSPGGPGRGRRQIGRAHV